MAGHYFLLKKQNVNLATKHGSTTNNNNNKRATKLFSNNFNESFFLIINSFMEKNHLRNSFEKKIIIKILKGIAKLL
jgi:hypothetical protein